MVSLIFSFLTTDLQPRMTRIFNSQFSILNFQFAACRTFCPQITQTIIDLRFTDLRFSFSLFTFPGVLRHICAICHICVICGERSELFVLFGVLGVFGIKPADVRADTGVCPYAWVVLWCWSSGFMVVMHCFTGGGGMVLWWQSSALWGIKALLCRG